MRIAVGLSGGVDSSVAALLLKRAGHDVVGVAMNLWEPGRYPDKSFEACFGPGAERAMSEAARFADELGVPFEVFDCADPFEREVLRYFRAEREAGRTPNPCVVCNRVMKFGLLPELAFERLGADRFATGHYARLEERGGRFALVRAVHAAKDQSYFLWGLSQERLARALFPLGGLTKGEVRSLAREARLASAEKTDSQDFYSGDADDLLKLAPREGELVDLNGKVLARHGGHWHFTVGQRKGLGVATGTPMYVVEVDACRNRVTVGPREEAVRTSFAIDPATVNWVATPPTDAPVACRVKVRSAGEPVGPVTYHEGRVSAPGGVFGVAPGQSAVFYAADSDDLLFGGVILGCPPRMPLRHRAGAPEVAPESSRVL